MVIRAAEFYSGIGGLHLGLSRSSVNGLVVRAYDWDQSACQVYDANYGKGIAQKADISRLTASELAGLNASLWLLSPSCQPYTVLNPLAKGAEDPRAKSFIHLMENILPELVSMGKHPTHMLIENVAGFESSSTRQRLLHVLKQLNYTVTELLLTPLQYGVPNSRLRYYLLAKHQALEFANVPRKSAKEVWRHIPGHGEDYIDDRRGDSNGDSSVTEIRNYLNADMPDEEFSKYAIPDRVLEKWGRLFDIVLPSSRRTCCFTRGYTKMAERSGSVLQLNENLDTTTLFNQFLEQHASGDNQAVRTLDALRLRYFTPGELLRLFCFDDIESEGQEPPHTFVWPSTISTKTKYKLLGNSVNVRVVTQLINYLFE
ncbi:S-adenosyl-L-methionine-dependent methyltransferase [Panus rudis PR-1116 ss-1]|nr:S-adenosyl-L-methionine-dependent methyltransferase [Panus rudis PR-1116 ss-1]